MRDIVAPMYDQAYSALLEDLDQRGMLDSTLVSCLAEFGRTPKVNPAGGRDHWPQVSCALMAGGGMQTGQAIGATNRLGEYAAVRPVNMQEENIRRGRIVNAVMLDHPVTKLPPCFRHYIDDIGSDRSCLL